MRLSRTRSIALAAAAAVTASGVVVPSAIAQEETAPDAETAAVSESAVSESAESESESESESETPAPDETDPEDEPEDATTAPAQINLTVEADSDKSTISRVLLEEEDEVKKALENHPSVSWSFKGDSLPVGMKFSTVSSELTIDFNQLRGKVSHTFAATDLATGKIIAEVTVTATGEDAPVNPGDKRKDATPRQVAIIVGVAAAIAAALAGMVQFLVPGGWQHVISYFTGQR